MLPDPQFHPVGEGSARFAAVQATDEKSQVQEDVQLHRGQGVQHIVPSTNDIFLTLRTLLDQSFTFLRVPDTHFELLPRRVAKSGYTVQESLDEAKELGIQIDGDETGYLFQIITEDQIGPVSSRPSDGG